MSTCLVSGTLLDPSETPITGAAVSYNVQSCVLDRAGNNLLGSKAVSTTTGWTFTITSGNATAGATYTNSGTTYTVVTTVASGTSLQVTGTGTPAASGTLTKTAGTGDSTLTFSTFIAGTWQLSLSQGTSGTLLIDIPADSTNGTSRYEFTIGVPVASTAMFPAIWVEASSASPVTVPTQLANGQIWIGSGTNLPVAWTITGDAGISNAGVLTLASVATPGTSTKVTYNAKGLITSGTTLSSGDIPNNAANTSGTAAGLSSTLAIGSGGTGQTTANAALNALLPAQAAQTGKLLSTDGTNTAWTSAATGTVTSVAMTVPSGLAVAGSPVTTSGTLAITASGQFAASQMPAFTGDFTTSAGAVATTAAATQANITSLSNASGVAVHGTNTNDSASAGFVGQYISSAVSTPTNAPTTGQFGDATNIALTAGDWDISLVVFFSANGATTNEVRAGISTTSGNSSTGLLTGDNYVAQIGPTVNFNSSMCIANYRASLSAGATYYLKVLAAYSVGTPQYTCRISARRVR